MPTPMEPVVAVEAAAPAREEVLQPLRRRAEIRAKGARPFLSALCREFEGALVTTGPQALSMRRMARQAEWQAQNYSFDVNSDVILLTEGCELERDAEVTSFLDSLEAEAKEASAFCSTFRHMQDRLKKELDCLHVPSAPHVAARLQCDDVKLLVAEPPPARLTQDSLPGLLPNAGASKVLKPGFLRADLPVPRISYSQAFRSDIVQSEPVPLKNWESPLELPLPGQLYEEPMASARSTEGEPETASEGSDLVDPVEGAAKEDREPVMQEPTSVVPAKACDESLQEEEEVALTPCCASDPGSDSFLSAPEALELQEAPGLEELPKFLELGSQPYELLCAALPCKELFALRLVCTSAKMDTNREIEVRLKSLWLGARARVESPPASPTHAEARAPSVEETPVKLNIYDVTTNPTVQWINSLFANQYSPVKFGGIFHVGVQIGSREWAFGYKPSGTGVFWTPPLFPGQHHFRETIDMPPTTLSRTEIAEVMTSLEIKWSGPSYNVFRRNCCHFADEVCEILGVGNIPEWTYRLANIGSTAAEVIRVLDAPGLLPLSYSHANTAPAVADAPAIARDTSEHMNV